MLLARALGVLVAMPLSFDLVIRRFLAFFIDSTVLGVVGFSLNLSPMIMLMLSWMYFAGLESSSLRATPGKKCLKLRIDTPQGEQVSLRQATVRFFGRYVSAFIFYIGYLAILVSKRKQAFHDFISGCIISREN